MKARIQLPSTASRWVAHARRASEFLVGQTAAQLLQAITGLVLLRWLSVPAYAQYSVTTAIDSTLRLFVDLGASSSIVPIVSPVASDKGRAGGYVKAVLNFRARTYLLLVVPTVLAFFVVSRIQNWNAWLTAGLCVTTLISVWFNGLISVHGQLLSVHRRLKPYYHISAAAGTLRLAVLAILKFIAALNALAAAAVNALVTCFTVGLLRNQSRGLIELPIKPEPAQAAELRAFLKPVIPLALYIAAQGQITLFLVTVFGKSDDIAALGALSRLAQLFTLLTAAQSMLIAPIIASSTLGSLHRRYGLVAVTSGAIAGALIVFAFLLPGPFLWLLGGHYSHLHRELGWTVVASSIGYLGQVIYSLNIARKWVYTQLAFAGILLQFVSQLIAVLVLDLSQVIHAVYMNVLVAAAALLPQLVASGVGLARAKVAS